MYSLVKNSIIYVAIVQKEFITKCNNICSHISNLMI